MGSPMLRSHAGISSVSLGTQLAAIACHRLVGRFLPGTPAGLLDKPLGEHFVEVDFEGIAKLAAGGRQSTDERVDAIPSASRREREELAEQLHGSLDVLI